MTGSPCPTLASGRRAATTSPRPGTSPRPPRRAIAALDGSPAARGVLETGIGFGHLTGVGLEAVHVRDGSTETPQWLAAQAGVELRVLDGMVATAILDAVAAPDVSALLLGSTSRATHDRPVGHIALEVLQHCGKPTVVVPPAVAPGVPSLRRLLVPLEGTAASSRPVTDDLCALVATDVELLVVHVFTRDTLPHVLDHPQRDLSIWGGEFLARHCPGAADVQLRIGSPVHEIAALCTGETADLVVLSWSLDMSPGHAEVIQGVLERSTVPVLLLPASAPSGEGMALDDSGANAGGVSPAPGSRHGARRRDHR